MVPAVAAAIITATENYVKLRIYKFYSQSSGCSFVPSTNADSKDIYLFPQYPQLNTKILHIILPKKTKRDVYGGLSNAQRDRELKSKLAKQHNRKCEGQEDRASSLSLHRQQSAAALLTPENWSSSSSDAKTFKLLPLYTTKSQQD